MSTSSVTGTPSRSICIMGSCSPILSSDHPRALFASVWVASGSMRRSGAIVGSMAGTPERPVVPGGGTPARRVAGVAPFEDVAAAPALAEHLRVHVADLPPLGEV